MYLSSAQNTIPVSRKTESRNRMAVAQTNPRCTSSLKRIYNNKLVKQLNQTKMLAISRTVSRQVEDNHYQKKAKVLEREAYIR